MIKKMEIDIKHACSFTGHRPERLEIKPNRVVSWLEEQIRRAIEDGYTDFISGMQRGVDIWAAEIVLKLKMEGKPVRLISACAWNGMEKLWEQSWKDRYKSILNNADEIVYVSKFPGRAAFFERNHWMVDHSSRLIGVYTGAPGGSKETIEYAKKKGLEVITITK